LTDTLPKRRDLRPRKRSFSDRLRTPVTLTLRMARAAAGPLVSSLALFALPLCGAIFLTSTEYAFWAILASVSTVALSLDFGGVSLLTARYFAERRGPLIVRATALSVAGSLLITIGSCLVWALFYSHTALGSTVPELSALGALATIGIAAALRSALMVIAQAALLSNSHRLRDFSTAGHAIIAAIVTIVVLIVMKSYWALPLGWLVAGVIVLLPAALWTRSMLQGESYTPNLHQEIRVGRYATLRTIATILGSVLFQCDRWIIGAIGGAQILAVYDITWRFANMPRFLSQNLATRIGADTAAMRSADIAHARRMLGATTSVLSIITVSASLAMAALYWGFTYFSHHGSNWVLFIAMCVAFGLVGMTAPLSTTGVAVGKGGIDLPNLTFCVALTCVFAIIAGQTNFVWLFVYGYLGTLSVGAAIYFAYAPRAVIAGLRVRRSI
jgi:O-antigen/teichoic acid export membrane protein